MASNSTTVELLQRFIQFPTVSCQPIVSFASEMAERGESVGGVVHRFETSTTKQNVVVQLDHKVQMPLDYLDIWMWFQSMVRTGVWIHLLESSTMALYLDVAPAI